MAKYATDYSIDELMAVTIARDLQNGEIGFIGLGTGGRAFQLAVGIPFAASNLARLTHAPDYHILLGMMMDPRPDRMPDNFLESDEAIVNWPCASRISSADIFDLFRTGKLGVGFVSGAQIDQYGNLNIVAIGDYYRPKARLVGALLQTEHMAFANRNIIPVDLSRRTFVPKVDFRSGFGFGDGYDSRQKHGLPGGGPKWVVTNMAVFDFEETSKRMRIHSVHPGFTVEQVRENCGFELVVPDEVPFTEPPTREQVDLLRRVIDPKGLLMSH